jgi:hypothetical protein
MDSRGYHGSYDILAKYLKDVSAKAFPVRFQSLLRVSRDYQPICFHPPGCRAENDTLTWAG